LINNERIEKMFQIAAVETYQDGQIIFKEGSAGDWIYIIESGAVELFKSVGKEKVVVEVLQPGDILGEIAFLARIPRTASAQAVGATSVGVIDRSYLDQEYNRLSASFRMLLKSLALRLEKTTEKTAQPKLRRKDPRAPKVISLNFKNNTDFITAFSKDMGAGGIFIKTAHPFDKGEKFILKLQLPDASETFKIGCTVAWSRTKTDNPAKRPTGMGAKFIEISAADRHRLKAELIKPEPKE